MPWSVSMRFKNPASPRTCTHCRVLFFAAVVLAWVPPWISGSPASPRTCSHCRMGFPRCRSPRLASLWIWESSLAAHLHSLPCAFPRCRCPRLGPPLDFGESSLAAHTRSLPHGFSSLPLSSPGFLLDLGAQPRRTLALIAAWFFLAAFVLAAFLLGSKP